MISLDNIYNPIHFTQTGQVGLRNLPAHLEMWAVNMDPEYQRDHVWSDDQAMDLMGHLLEGGTVPDIIVNEVLLDDTEGLVSGLEVVDGKQRLTACLRWLRDEIPARLTDGRLIWKKDLDRNSLTTLSTSIRLSFKHVRLDEVSVLRLYLRLNRGGTVHTEAEIERVRALLATAEAAAR